MPIIISLGMVPVLLLFLQLLGCMPLLGTSSPLTAAVDKGLDDFYPIVNGLPTGFVFGTASAAYQIEGAVKEGGRGATIWDTFSHMDPPKVARGENGDVACDSYHRYEEDADLAKAAGFNGFRLSFAWSRIYPEGEGDEPNAEGVQHYHDVLDALLERGLEPMVTLYHWDLPQALEDKHGGWLNASIVPAFEAYADTCFREYGGKVKKWLTLNEPWSFIHHGYSSGMHAPGRCSDRKVCDKGDSFTEPYLAGHNALNAHARAVSVYRTRYKADQGGVIGITLNCDWGMPLDPDSDEDKEAAKRAVDFQLGWWADPIYFGDYPHTMRDRVGVRLPKFTEEERALLMGSNDFFGLNHYTSWYYTDIPDTDPPRNGTSAAAAKASGIDLPKTPPHDGWAQDLGAIMTKLDLEGQPNGFATESPWLTAVPGGFRVLLKHVAERYGSPAIMVTENGMDREGEAGMGLEEALADGARKAFYDGYLRSMVAAIVEDGVDVRSYYAWSVLDNFEWSDGYTPRFGLTYVDYGADQARTPKDSSKWFARLAEARDAHAHWRATADGVSPATAGNGGGDGDSGGGSGVGGGGGKGDGDGDGVSRGQGGGQGAGRGPERERGGKFWVELSLLLAAVVAVAAAFTAGKLGGRWGWAAGEPRQRLGQHSRQQQRYEVVG